MTLEAPFEATHSKLSVAGSRPTEPVEADGTPGCTRRRFLQTSLAAAAVASRTVWAQSHRAWKMRLSTSSIHFMQLPIEQACERIAGLGYEAVDIWSAHSGCPHLDDVQKRLGPDGLRKLLEKTGLKLCAFSVYRGGYPRYAKLLGDFGGGLAIHGSGRFDRHQPLTKQMKAFFERLKPEIELAERYDSYVAIENHGNNLLNTLDSFRAFVELNPSPRVGIALAPYHLQRLGASVEEAIRIAGKQLLFFYAWQRAGHGSLEQLPGHGPTDFTPWLAALAEVHYTGYVNPFMHGKVPTETMSQALGKAKGYLENCWKKLSST